jgi:hypothetical protein
MSGTVQLDQLSNRNLRRRVDMKSGQVLVTFYGLRIWIGSV